MIVKLNEEGIHIFFSERLFFDHYLVDNHFTLIGLKGPKYMYYPIRDHMVL